MYWEDGFELITKLFHVLFQNHPVSVVDDNKDDHTFSDSFYFLMFFFFSFHKISLFLHFLKADLDFLEMIQGVF